MKLLQTIASNVGFRDLDHNATRLDVLDGLLTIAKREVADVVLLPGGYLTSRSVNDVPEVIAKAEYRAIAAGIAVIGGVDVLPGARNAKQSGKTAPLPDLPFYGFAVGLVAPRVPGTRWKQTSSTGDNAATVADVDVPGEGRVVDVDGGRVGVLVCGELFSRRARKSFANLNLKLALDLGHESMGTGVTRAMENIARNGNCAVAHTHHVANWGNQSLHFVRSDGVRDSVPLKNCDWVGGDEFWVAWCVREV